MNEDIHASTGCSAPLPPELAKVMRDCVTQIAIDALAIGPISPRDRRKNRKPGVMPMTHYWRIRATLPERYGQPCRIVATGKLHSCLVEFADGQRVVTSRYSVRRRHA